MTNELIKMIETARNYKNLANEVRFGRKTFEQFENERIIDIAEYHKLIQKITIEMVLQKVPQAERKEVYKIWA